MIKQPEYQRRRKQLLRSTGEGGVVIVRSAPERIRNNDVLYPYRQRSDFLYLTGFREPGGVLVLLSDGDAGTAIMFCRERDEKREMWDGPMAGTTGVLNDFGMDEAYPLEELDRRLPPMLEDRERIYYDLGQDSEFDAKLIGWLSELRGKPRRTFHAPDEIIGLDHLLHDMRLYKSRTELTAMRKSARVAAAAHRRAMAVCKPGLSEAHIHAELLHEFTANHCEASYPPIVAAGDNACVLHYIANRADMGDGDLLLIDAGAEYDGYASDITRTFPVSGRYTGPQRELYELVLAAQLEAIDQVRAGRQWNDVHMAAVNVLTRGMLDLGILKGGFDDAIEKESYKRFYVHNTGHWLGLDVHDVGEYQIDGHSRELEPGMVLTVEPGLYIRSDETSVRKQWRGIGIRIEDDVVVTRDEPEVISRQVPKTVAEIEELMAA